MQLHIKVDSTELTAQIDSLRDDLVALKQVPQFPLDELLRLGDAILTQLSVSGGCAAIIAGDDRLIIQIARELEIFAAAVAALKLYVHAVLPQRL